LHETADRDLDDIEPRRSSVEESHPAPKVEQEDAKELLLWSRKVAAVSTN